MCIKIKATKYIILSLVFLLSLTILSAQSIRRINFRGNHTFSSSQLQKQLTLKPESFLSNIGLKKKEDSFHKYILNDDLSRLENFYQKNGFLSVNIRSRVKRFEKDNSVSIDFIIKENKPVLIDSICFCINSNSQADSLLVRNE